MNKPLFSYQSAREFLPQEQLEHQSKEAQKAMEVLEQRTGRGNDFLGWLDLPLTYDQEEFRQVQKAAKKIQHQSQALVVIGIGGSYLGARAAIEFLNGPFYNQKKTMETKIYFAGNSISPSYHQELLTLLEDQDFSVNVISKSGTTTEPAIAFRLFRALLEKKYGKEGARERIYVTTDGEKGALLELAKEENYERFTIADDVGGRYSVLTSVGLLPIAVSGADLTLLMKGASAAYEDCKNPDFQKNMALQYAAVRHVFLNQGKSIEILVNYEPALTYFSEWYKQLFGESEGKEGKGLYPSSLNFSTDLHSLGQFVQEGTRNMFETVLKVEDPGGDILLKEEAADGDGLNFLAGKTMDFVNTKAFLGTLLAHTDGKTPNVMITIPKRDEFNLGYLFYFFQKACGISGYMLKINPFDQPGVEAYKKNMFALLGKPGFEDLKEVLEERIRQIEEA